MKNKYQQTKCLFFTVFALSLIMLSCKKFVEISPPIDSLDSKLVFDDFSNANAAIAGIYSQMMNSPSLFTSNKLTLYAGLYADGLYYYSPSLINEFTKSQITENNHSALSMYFWNPAYNFILASNLAINGLQGNSEMPIHKKNQLIGEARFIRAFCYFQLVNIFGDVPLVTSDSYKENMKIGRTRESEIYDLIISDLKNAEAVLPVEYVSPERSRPNKWAAATFLARVYLYNKRWQDAATEATKVINAGAYSLDSDLDSVFLKESKGTIWQLQPVYPRVNTWEGNAILPASASAAPTYLITSNLINAFEPGDGRKNAWTATRNFLGEQLRYPYKYKIKRAVDGEYDECYVVLRLAEDYLIRAEAEAQQNDITGGLKDMNTIRRRAGLKDTLIDNKQSLLDAIMKQRRLEFFAEWGQRWFDLKRTGRADSVLARLKPTTWRPTDTLWPIPINQINVNPNLYQNKGY